MSYKILLQPKLKKLFFHTFRSQNCTAHYTHQNTVLEYNYCCIIKYLTDITAKLEESESKLKESGYKVEQLQSKFYLMHSAGKEMHFCFMMLEVMNSDSRLFSLMEGTILFTYTIK